mmetsp:Transcript_21354/g.34773  ORF Transcript_21354/g.34773 Transcript_21354/m.34773 type:complete len:261 (-) Transcript_21354:2025-2807(-)
METNLRTVPEVLGLRPRGDGCARYAPAYIATSVHSHEVLSHNIATAVLPTFLDTKGAIFRNLQYDTSLLLARRASFVPSFARKVLSFLLTTGTWSHHYLYPWICRSWQCLLHVTWKGRRKEQKHVAREYPQPQASHAQFQRSQLTGCCSRGYLCQLRQLRLFYSQVNTEEITIKVLRKAPCLLEQKDRWLLQPTVLVRESQFHSQSLMLVDFAQSYPPQRYSEDRNETSPLVLLLGQSTGLPVQRRHQQTRTTLCFQTAS